MAKIQCVGSTVSLLEAILMKESFRDTACSSRKYATWLDVYHAVKEKHFERVECILVSIYGKNAYRSKIGYKSLQKLCRAIRQIEDHSVAKRNHFLDRSSSCVLALASIVIAETPSVNCIPKPHEVDALLSICTNDAVKLEELLLMDSSLTNTSSCCKGMTPIHFAVLWDNIDSLLVLLKYPEITNLINQKDLYGWSALHYAVQSSSVMATRLLLQTGADMNIRLQEGSTPLHLAAYYSIPELVFLLCRHGADVSAVNSSGETPLLMATRSAIKIPELLGMHCTTMSLLLRYGSSPNSRDNLGRTPIFYVSFYCEDENCALMLCAAGAELNFPSRTKRKSRMLSSATRSNDIRRFLEKIECNPLRLDIICLIKVRKTMGKSFSDGVKQLPLTDGVKKMLLFQTLPKLV